LQTPVVASALAKVQDVGEKLVKALGKGQSSPGSLDQLANVIGELGQATTNLEGQIPGHVSHASGNKLKNGFQSNAPIGGKSPEGRVFSEASNNEAESGLQINSFVFGDISALANLAKSWAPREGK